MKDRENKVWKTFVEFNTLIGTEGKTIGLDLFGTDQSASIALSLTQAHYINELRKEIQTLFTNDELKRSC